MASICHDLMSLHANNISLRANKYSLRANKYLRFWSLTLGKRVFGILMFIFFWGGGGPQTPPTAGFAPSAFTWGWGTPHCLRAKKYWLRAKNIVCMQINIVCAQRNIVLTARDTPCSVSFCSLFLGFVLEYQMYSALCEKAGHTGPLHRCSLYGSKEAGTALRSVGLLHGPANQRGRLPKGVGRGVPVMGGGGVPSSLKFLPGIHGVGWVWVIGV